MQRAPRMKREMQLFEKSPPHGVSCWSKGDSLEQLEAQIVGPEGTPYEGGIFKLEIQIPDRYPFEPPKMRFATPVYHPNIDNVGRICLDSLKMPPKGAWKPALNISTLLTSILLLLSEPNPDDPLMADISNEFRYNKAVFQEKAKQWTQKYASGTATSGKAETADATPLENGIPCSSSSSTSAPAPERKIHSNSPSPLPLQENTKRTKS